jgi:hypothetical protein
MSTALQNIKNKPELPTPEENARIEVKTDKTENKETELINK